MIIDGLVLATLLLSALIAFFRGFVREVLTLCGLAGALASAYFFSPYLVPFVQDMLGSDPDARLFGILPMSVAANVGAFAAVFLITLILLTLVAHAISHGLHAAGLGSVDRTLGVLFGLLRGAVLILLFYIPFYFTAADAQKAEWFQGSATLPVIDMAAHAIEPYLPDYKPAPKDGEKTDAPQEPAEPAPEEPAEPKPEAKGFDRLDSLMRQALESDSGPEIVKGAMQGYSQQQNDALDNTVKAVNENDKPAANP